jgi:hypothetical protein
MPLCTKLERPWRFQEFEVLIFQFNRHKKMLKFFSPTHRPQLPPRELFLIFIYCRGCVHSTARVRAEGLCQWKIPMTLKTIERATFRHLAQCLNKLLHCVQKVVSWQQITQALATKSKTTAVAQTEYDNCAPCLIVSVSTLQSAAHSIGRSHQLCTAMLCRLQIPPDTVHWCAQFTPWWYYQHKVFANFSPVKSTPDNTMPFSIGFQLTCGV